MTNEKVALFGTVPQGSESCTFPLELNRENLPRNIGQRTVLFLHQKFQHFAVEYRRPMAPAAAAAAAADVVL